MESQLNRDDKLKVLKDVFGYSSFRPAQSQIIDNILAKRDVLAVMPTGAGKSLCFQIPALMMDGITFVISPLISLMTDQVSSLVQAGVRAAYLNSFLTFSQQQKVRENIIRGMYKIVYVSPERLDTDGFAELGSRVNISMIAVDEAHCISQWGQDFRPSYLNIVKFVSTLPCRPIISAFTATATEAVKEDIKKILSLSDPYSVTTGFDRPNLYFGVEEPTDKYKALLKHLEEHSGKSGIIYCSTRKNVENVAFRLIGDGYSAAPYHAGMSDEQRRKNQEDFIYDRVNIIVATNAFGMGIDKSNVSFVIHYNMPKDMESYYQEAGRAGRDGENADCVILFNGQDYATARYMINSDSPRENSETDENTRKMLISRDMKRLDFMMGYCSGVSCLRTQILRYFGEDSEDDCGNCSVCLDDSEKTDITVESQKILSCVFRMGQKYGSSLVCTVLRGGRSERAEALGFQNLSTYGILSDLSSHRIRLMINKLIALNYLEKTDEEYPVLKLTSRSAAVLKGRERIEALLPKEKLRKERRAELRSRAEEREYSIDAGLMTKLKEVRLGLAKEQNVPAYHIFSDATLRDMCSVMPTSKEQMLSVSGVGAKKLESYGELFLSAISDWRSEHGDVRKLSDEEKNAVQNPLAAVAAKIGEVDITDENLSLTMMCSSFIDAAGVNIKTKIIREVVGKWLVLNGYLAEGTDSMGKSCKMLTETSGDIGIISEVRTAQTGKQYVNILYTPKARRFIADHFEEISKTEL